MGKLTNLNPPAPIADADLPASIARDTETTAAMAAHVAAQNPHNQYRKVLETQSFNGTFKAVGTSQGDITSTPVNNCGFEIQANANSAAFLSFHLPGIFGAHLGLGTDAQLRFGGWSFGNTSYRIWHEGNANLAVPPSSLYGSLGIQGVKNNYAGINFSDAFDSAIMMFSSNIRQNGVWSAQAAGNWWWYYSKGLFRIFNSEAINSVNQRGTYIALDKSTGSLPGYPNEDYPVLKTDASSLYFSVGNNYSAQISANGTYTSVSDKNRKENVQEVDYTNILKKLLTIPVYRYTFKGESSKNQRCGCFAQDFYSQFKLGGEEMEASSTNPISPSKTIAVSDQVGVLMAGLRALAEKVEFLEKSLAN